MLNLLFLTLLLIQLKHNHYGGETACKTMTRVQPHDTVCVLIGDGQFGIRLIESICQA